MGISRHGATTSTSGPKLAPHQDSLDESPICLRMSLRFEPPTHSVRASLPGKRATLPFSLPEAATSSSPLSCAYCKASRMRSRSQKPQDS